MKELEKPERLKDVLEEGYLSNPDVAVIENEGTILIRKTQGPDASIIAYMDSWHNKGYSVVYVPDPKITVDENEISKMGLTKDDVEANVRLLISEYNEKFERGRFHLMGDMVVFRHHISCRKGDDLTLTSLMDELNLGFRIINDYAIPLFKAVSGESVEEILKLSEEVPNKLNAAKDVTGEELYVPASNEATSTKTGGMYA